MTRTLERGRQRRTFDTGTWDLIQSWPSDPRVRRRALEELERPDPPLAAVAFGYRNDAGMRSRVIARLTPPPRVLREQVLEALATPDIPSERALSTLRRFRQVILELSLSQRSPRLLLAQRVDTAK